jgi:hypothetical protein
LERGLHALGACGKSRHDGRSIDAYAAGVGRPKQSVRNEVQAAEVYLVAKKPLTAFSICTIHPPDRDPRRPALAVAGAGRGAAGSVST